MKTRLITLALLLAPTSWAAAGGHDDKTAKVVARLHSHNEVPAVSSTARGRFTAQIDEDAQTIDYDFTFDGLQGVVLQSHIHFAQPNVNGAIVVWLCGTAANPGPAGTQVCPQSGTISGTITPANVLATGTQSIGAGEFSELVSAIRGGVAYVNVHTTQTPSGETRGQIRLKD